MSGPLDVVLTVLSALLILAGAFFFTAGTAGLIRFPDVRSQLHALTKADNLGLGLILAGVAVHERSVSTALLLGIAWLLLLGAASVSAHALAGAAVRREGEEPPAQVPGKLPNGQAGREAGAGTIGDGGGRVSGEGRAVAGRGEGGTVGRDEGIPS